MDPVNNFNKAQDAMDEIWDHIRTIKNNRTNVLSAYLKYTKALEQSAMIINAQIEEAYENSLMNDMMKGDPTYKMDIYSNKHFKLKEILEDGIFLMEEISTKEVYYGHYSELEKYDDISLP